MPGRAPDESSASPSDDQGPCTDGYWSGPFSTSARLLLMAGLVVCFAIQTWLVYSDPTPQPPPLRGSALEGRRIWHEYNCQSCHQFYGFGGFLGPDLTNVGPRLTRSHLETMLGGYGAMPAFEFTKDEVDGLEAFLRAMNETGVGQARAGSGLDPGPTLEKVLAEQLPADEDVRAGFELTRTLMCSTCHIPFGNSVTGAPDMSTAHSRVGKEGITQVLTKGRGAMPAFPTVTADQIDRITAFLAWFESERATVQAAYTAQMPSSIEWGKLPWWEYK